MKKKLDIVDKYELGIKQEIKNYQDSLFNITQSINELKLSIKSLSEKVNNNHGLIKSQNTLLEIELDITKKNILEFSSKVSSELNDIRLVQRKQADTMLSLSKTLSCIMNKESEIDKSVFDSNLKLESLKKELSVFKSDNNHEINMIAKRFLKSLEDMKEEITSRPSEYFEHKSYFDNKMQSHAINVKGVFEVIDKQKQSIYVMQKQIENLYTLINRLKKRNE
jgi:hypothetical protein